MQASEELQEKLRQFLMLTVKVWELLHELHWNEGNCAKPLLPVISVGAVHHSLWMDCVLFQK